MAASRFPQIPSFVEVLEPRVAPAVINVGPITGSTGYEDAPFIAVDSEAADPGVREVFAGSKDHYYLNLGPTDSVKFFAQGYEDYIKVSGGRAFAFFHDINKDAIVQLDELTGFSLAPATKLQVLLGGVNGDIVGNLNGLTQTLAPEELVAAKTSISSLVVEGNVNGRIIAGGDIRNVSVKTVEQITTLSDGSYTYDWSGLSPGSAVGRATLDPYSPGAKIAGGSIAGVAVAVLDDPNALDGRGAIIAGPGGPGGAGGSVAKVTITSDPNGFLILAGRGGDGSSGGNGGTVANVVVNGSSNFLPPAGVDKITIKAGDGGNALSAGGRGGLGGGLSSIDVGYNFNGRGFVQAPLGDIVEIVAGLGGSGAVGGAGGSISKSRIATDALDDNLTSFEIFVQAGSGGSGTSVNGNGGGVTSFEARNFHYAAPDGDRLGIFAGNGGAGNGLRGNGGSISTINVLSDAVQIRAGDGSDSTGAAGQGGKIATITLDYSGTDRVSVFDIRGGQGGDSVSSTAGGGGSVTNVKGLFVDLQDLAGSTPSRISGGDGGDSGAGAAGNGGSVTGLTLGEPVLLDPTKVVVASGLSVSGGAGGDGAKRGGAGGAVARLTFLGLEASGFSLTAGAGGDATLAGRGGNGGAVSNVAVSLTAANEVIGTLGLVQAGRGGDSAGPGFAAGAGGSVSKTTFVYDGNVSVLAGTGGGDGAGGSNRSAVGKGGSITQVSAFALEGDIKLMAGSAGTPTTSGVGASGGAVSGSTAVALQSITLQGGDGQLGRVGGGISKVSWYGVSDQRPDQGVAPLGDVLIKAGQGSVGSRSAGAGGNISNVVGLGTGAANFSLTIQAGDGNGGFAGANAAAGGSVKGVTLFGSDGPVRILAGNGGNLDPAIAFATKGGAGGSVDGVAVLQVIDPLTGQSRGGNVKELAAGDGGNGGLNLGGSGGSVKNINVAGDIGIRKGLNFGFDSMGGIFAGRGGDGNAADGKAGSVVGVTAQAISSIVAGRPTSAAPQSFGFVSLVDRVSLRGLMFPTVQPDGAFSQETKPQTSPPTVDYDEANVVGAVVSPFTQSANEFKILDGNNNEISVPSESLNLRLTSSGVEYDADSTAGTDWRLFRPIDGFIATLNLGTEAKNFRPQALALAADGGSTLIFADYRNNFVNNS